MDDEDNAVKPTLELCDRLKTIHLELRSFLTSVQQATEAQSSLRDLLQQTTVESSHRDVGGDEDSDLR